MANKTLQAAKSAKQDEFYTQLSDISNELKHYKEQFRGKVILCNCDDPYESNFFKYFTTNFNTLGLKELIATTYISSPVAWTQMTIPCIKSASKNIISKSQSTQKGNTHGWKIEITSVSDENDDGAINLSDVQCFLKKFPPVPLKGDGDFRSKECVDLLKEADIVITNPPFSLFREYVAQLIEHDKKFLIIGNDNAITYKNNFQYIKENKIWFGYNRVKEFIIPDGGTKKFGNIGWWTNLDTTKRHDEIPIFKKYYEHPEEYPKYVNYNAIEVSKVKDIPTDYEGEMGVPITFLDKYNPEQFIIIGSSRNLGAQMSQFAEKGAYVQGGVRFYLPNNDKRTYRCLYDRIVIKNKKVIKEK